MIGIDIGGTKIETAIFKRGFSQIESWRVTTPTKDYGEFIQAIEEQVIKADKLTDQKCVVGIGMPGLINNKGQVLSANVPCATGKYIAEDLEARLQRPVKLKNDTRCFALSEANNGAGHGYQRVFGAIIGTGAAGGLCIDGQLDDSKLGTAGEYGHLPLSAHLQQKYDLPILTCGCGLIGCVESYISGPGIEFLNLHLTGEKLTATKWAEQLSLEDVNAERVLECYLDILGESFASLCKLIEPDVIVLGGGVSKIALLATLLPQYIERYLFDGFHAPKVVCAKFGDSSGVRGAAMLGVL